MDSERERGSGLLKTGLIEDEKDGVNPSCPLLFTHPVYNGRIAAFDVLIYVLVPPSHSNVKWS